MRPVPTGKVGRGVAWRRPRLRQLPRLVHRGPVLVRRPNSTKAQVHTAVGQSSCDASYPELSPKAGAHRWDNALVPDGVPRHSDRAASIRLQAQLLARSN